MPKSAQEAQYDELSRAIARVLFPVMICMILAVLLVRAVDDTPGALTKACSARGGVTEFPRAAPITANPFASGTNSGNNNNASGNSNNGGSIYSGKAGIIFVGIFVLCMVVFTFALLLLYKYGCIHIIQGWLLVAVLLIFGYVGGVFLFDLCRSRCWNLDWISLAFITWNFTVTGIIAVFGTAPRLVNQAYLIIMSALMAFIFRNLPDAAIWVILVALVLWDLFAVLTPCGPLRMLVEIARQRGDSLPALVYDTNPRDVGRDEEATQAIARRTKEEREADKQRRKEARERKALAAADARAARAAAQDSSTSSPPESNNPDAAPAPGTNRSPLEGLQKMLKMPKLRRPGTRAAATDAASPEAGSPRPIGTLGHHLKLGLGDFVFYSILVVQASKHGAMAGAVSFVAILTGLCLTLFLVVVYRKALPALPISIVLGMVFYALARFTIQPIADTMLEELLFH
jgi:presenilin 1